MTSQRTWCHREVFKIRTVITINLSVSWLATACYTGSWYDTCFPRMTKARPALFGLWLADIPPKTNQLNPTKTTNMSQSEWEKGGAWPRHSWGQKKCDCPFLPPCLAPPPVLSYMLQYWRRRWSERAQYKLWPSDVLVLYSLSISCQLINMFDQ